MDPLTVFLEEQEEQIVQWFKNQVVVSDHDVLKDRIPLNGRAMYRMVIGYFRSEVTEEDIRDLAYRVACERNQANINIGDFVHNVCLGRKLILDHLQNGGVAASVLLPALIKINECFDIFLEYAVSKYTELKNRDLAEKQLFIERSHKDRLTILGQLASSFVHEFRNPLTSIIGFSKLLREDYPDLPYLSIIENELHQLNYSVSQFLLVSKKGSAVLKEDELIHVVQLFEEILAFLYPTIVDVNAEITCVMDPACELTGSRDEIRQVLINILSNALDALQRITGDRHITIEVSQDGVQAVIAISNNGVPIPSDVLPVIFEPFFTTKEMGTGLGLYVCKEIIERHGGTITCQSADERTAFIMCFKQKDIFQGQEKKQV